MAPEQVLGHEIDARADLYGAGVVLYRLLTGQLPFAAENTIAVVQKQVADDPAPLHVHRNDLPEWCETIVQRALAKSPDARFQTADDFRAALRAAAGLPPDLPATVDTPLRVVPVPVQPTPVSPAVPKTVVTGRPSTAALRRAQAGRAKRRKPWLARPALAIVGIATGMLLVFVIWGPGLARLQSTYSAAFRAADDAEPPSGPVSYAARVLIGSGPGQRDMRCRLMLGEKGVRVASDDRRSTLHEVSYDHVRAISYSHGFDPMWTGPSGPTVVVRANNGTLGSLGIFVQRDWVSLRTTNPDAEFIVLRFDDEGRARRAVGVLEKRTRVRADYVTLRGR
jgi:hypothetical protein